MKTVGTNDVNVVRNTAILTAIGFSGCSYLDQRLADIGDCFIYRAHFLSGIAADVKVGPAELALGGWFGWSGWGKDTWWHAPDNALTMSGMGVPLTSLAPILDDKPWHMGLSTSIAGSGMATDSFQDVRSWLLLSDVIDMDEGSPFHLSTRQKIVDMLGVEVGVAPLFVGIHAGINLAELADFVIGFFGIDILGDDNNRPQPAVRFKP